MFIARAGRQPYELPEQHTATLSEYDGTPTVDLESPGAGGRYYIEKVDETDERIIVWVGEALIKQGPSGSRGAMGYPFLD